MKYAALTKETTDQAQIASKIAELEARIAALKAQASASETLSGLHAARVEEVEGRKEEGFAKLQKLESFGAKTSSFIQEVLKAVKLKRENGVKRSREVIRGQITEADRFKREAFEARTREHANRQNILAALEAFGGRRASGESSERTSSGRNNGGRQRGPEASPTH